MGLLGMLSGAASGGGGVNVGTAVAYLELNTERFNAGLDTAVSKLGSASGGLASSLKNAGSAMTSMGSALTKSVTLPVVGLGTAAVKTFANFEQGMADVKAIAGQVTDSKEFQSIINIGKEMGLSWDEGADMTATAMNIIKAKAEQVGATTEWTSTQAAEAFKYMALAGWDVGDMLYGIDPIINLATASQEDLGRVSDIVTDSLTAYGLTAKDASHFTDLLAQTQRSSNTTVSLMGESMKFAAPLVGSLGMSAEDASIALGLMANAGIKSSMAGTSLRSVLSRMAKPTKETQAAMDELGISLEDDNGNMYSMRQIFDQIRKQFQGGQGDVKAYTSQMAQLDEQYASGQITQEEYENATQELTTALYGVSGAEKVKLAAMLAGKTGMAGLMAIVNASEEDYVKLTAAIDNCSGATSEMAEIMRDTTENKMKLMTSAIDAMMRSFGELLAPSIQKAAEWIKNLAEKINGLDDSTKKMIVTIGAIVAAVGPVLIIFGSLTKTIASVITIFGKIGSAIIGVAGHFTKVGSAASNMAGSLTKAGSAAGSAGTSFGTLAGEALKMVAAAAVILAAAKAIQMLADSAIKLYQAGPGAVATFALLTAGALAMVAVIGAVASACTAGAAGLLSLGAAVLMVSTGIALVTAAIALLVEAFTHLMQAMLPLADKMPIFAEYGSQAAISMAAFGAAAALAAPYIVALDVALAAFDITAAVAVPLINSLSSNFTALNMALTALTATVKIFGEIFSETIKTMADAVAYAVRLIIQLMTEMVDTIIELFKRLKYELIGDPIVLDIVDGIVNAFLEMVRKVVQFISDLVQKVIQFFADLLQKTKEFISNVISTVSEFISNIISKVVEFFSNVISKAVEFFSNVWNKVKEFFTNLINTIVEKVEEIINKVREFFSNLINLIIEKVQEILNKIKEFFSNMMSAISEFISNAWEKIKSFISDVVNAIVDFVNDMLNKIKEFFAKLKETVNEKLQQIHEFIKEKLSKIIDFVKELIPKMLQAGKDLITGLWDGMKQVFGNLWSWVQESFGKIVDFVGKAWDKVKSIGGSIREAVGGLFDGSHATGLSYVPYNGYIAQLHEGERVLTKQENREYSQGRSGRGDTYNIYSYEKLDEYAIRRELMKMKRQLEL